MENLSGITQNNTKKKIHNLISLAAVILIIAAELFYLISNTHQILLTDAQTTGEQNSSGPRTESIIQNPVIRILNHISNGDIKAARTLIIQYSQENNHTKEIPPELIDYLMHFYDKTALFYGTPNYGGMDTRYFIKNSEPLLQYLEELKLNRFQCIQMAEIIPYYLIREFDQFNKKQNLNHDLYLLYLRTFVFPRQGLSSNSADIICLSIYSAFTNSKTKDTDLDIIKEIEKFRQTYSIELSETGTLSKQRDYLNNASRELEKNRNKKIRSSNRIFPYVIN